MTLATQLNKCFLNTTFQGIGMILQSIQNTFGKYNCNCLQVNDNVVQIRLTPKPYFKGINEETFLFHYRKAVQENMKQIYFIDKIR